MVSTKHHNLLSQTDLYPGNRRQHYSPCHPDACEQWSQLKPNSCAQQPAVRTALYWGYDGSDNVEFEQLEPGVAAMSPGLGYSPSLYDTSFCATFPIPLDSHNEPLSTQDLRMSLPVDEQPRPQQYHTYPEQCDEGLGDDYYSSNSPFLAVTPDTTTYCSNFLSSMHVCLDPLIRVSRVSALASALGEGEPPQTPAEGIPTVPNPQSPSAIEELSHIRSQSQPTMPIQPCSGLPSPYAASPSHSSTSELILRPVKTCSQCGKTETPAWRRNPADRSQVLCNACGIRVTHEKRPSHRGASIRDRTCGNLECKTKTTTAWRKGKDGAFYCNPCGLQLKNHGYIKPLLSGGLLRRAPSKRSRKGRGKKGSKRGVA